MALLVMEAIAVYSLLQCGNTISLHLRLLQAILVPVLQYGCQIWGMHSPRVAAANDARAALQCLSSGSGFSRARKKDSQSFLMWLP